MKNENKMGDHPGRGSNAKYEPRDEKGRFTTENNTTETSGNSCGCDAEEIDIIDIYEVYETPDSQDRFE